MPELLQLHFKTYPLQFNCVPENITDWLSLDENWYNLFMKQRTKYLDWRVWLLLVIGFLGVLTLVLLQVSSNGPLTGGQDAAARESGTAMQTQQPAAVHQRPAIDLALPQVTETALFALG